MHTHWHMHTHWYPPATHTHTHTHTHTRPHRPDACLHVVHINLIRFLLKVDSQTLAIVSKDGKKLIEHFPVDMCTFKLVEVIFLPPSSPLPASPSSSSCSPLPSSSSSSSSLLCLAPSVSDANLPPALQLRRCAHACAVSCYGLRCPPARITGTSPAFPLASSPPTRPKTTLLW
jgi:hypothetical protein